MPLFYIFTFAGSEKVLENFSWRSWKVPEKWIFLSVKEPQPGGSGGTGGRGNTVAVLCCIHDSSAESMDGELSHVSVQDQFTGKVPLGIVPVGQTNSLAQSLCPPTDSSVAYVSSCFILTLFSSALGIIFLYTASQEKPDR